MTAAKPQSMAAQSDAPDDLIAELARLMADDARSDQAPRAETPAQPKPAVRIPGGDAPAVTPVPRFDFSASSAQATPKAAVAAPTVRIPGAEPTAAKPVEATPEPFNFDFTTELAKKPAGPTTPIAAAPVPPISPVDVPVEANQPELDNDSLSDLIAAELAQDMDAQDEPPVPETPVRTEDNFDVAPVFGLTAPAAETVEPEEAPVVSVSIEPVEPAAVEPVAPVASSYEPVPEPEPQPAPQSEPVATFVPQRDESDPLSEIERLVGPAVNMGREEPRAPSPALRSLATPTIPRQEPTAPAPQPVTSPSSVDEAILAAAAATGARVEWVDPQHETATDDEPAALPRAPRAPFRMSRAVTGPLVALLLLGVAGVGLYWVLGQGGAPAGPAPLVVADTSPIKEVPEPVETETPQSVVFNEISGANDPADEQLVSRDQADEEVVAEVTAPTSTPIANSGVMSGTTTDNIDPNQAGLVNRKVRTVTVRPDGTIVSGDDSMAGATILPVDRPAVPEVPGADFSTPDLIANAEANVPTPAAPAEPVPATPAMPLVTPGTPAQVVDGTGAVITGKTVAVPLQRPADFAQAAASALAAAALPPTAPAVAAPATPVAQQPAAAPAPSGGTAAAYVQLSSQRSEQAARESAQAIINRFGPVFGGANIEIVRADLGERGVYYRVLVPANSRQEASNMCNNIKAAGGDCLLL